MIINSNWIPKLISFVIPTLNKIELLEQCLMSINDVCMAGYGIDYEIIIVQDGQSPGVSEKLVELKNEYRFMLIQNNRQLGYTRTVNRGMKLAAGDLIILLNDDIRFEQKEWLSLMLKAFRLHPRVGIVGCRLLYPDRTIQHCGMEYIGGLSLLGHSHLGRPDSEYAKRVRRTVAMTGAILAIRREARMDVGLLNEDLLMLCSDTDYCLSAHIKDWIVIYNGQAYAIHHESQTRRHIEEIDMLSKIESRDMVRFYRKWSGELKKMHMNGMI